MPGFMHQGKNDRSTTLRTRRESQIENDVLANTRYASTKYAIWSAGIGCSQQQTLDRMRIAKIPRFWIQAQSPNRGIPPQSRAERRSLIKRMKREKRLIFRFAQKTKTQKQARINFETPRSGKAAEL